MLFRKLQVGFGPKILILEVRITRQRRRLALAEIDEDETQIFTSGITPNANFFRKRFIFRELLDTLAGAVEFPAVKAATNAVVLDPPGRKLRSSVWTTKCHAVSCRRRDRG